MAAFTLSRLVVHELLIRVTADLHVQDGPKYEDLGLSLRGMVAQIFDHIAPELPALESRFSALRVQVLAELARLIDRDLFVPPPPVAKQGFLARLRGAKPAPTPPQDPELDALARWREGGGSDLENACLRALSAIVGGIIGQHGRLQADRDLILRLTANQVCNTYGSHEVGRWITPMLFKAAQTEGYRVLPFQKKPFVMNVKGASGAGKSTIRPLQRDLAERLGILWQDFALVSPDYWRKYLLDYASLGDDYKYAAMLTGQELEIIDKKLDRYMEEKAVRAEMPHLLIDRFRFDSFTASPHQQADGRLLSRFGDTVFLFLIITPPADTVERAWKRGLTTGRYKAVDDLLFHNIEAYTGMPQLFFNWVNKTNQKIHFEFLDNSVPLGSPPRTVAYGWNGQLTVLDAEVLRNMTRYRGVNIDAHRPEDVFDTAADGGSDILTDCIQRIAEVTFLDPDTLAIRGQTQNGKVVFQSDSTFAALSLSPDEGPKIKPKLPDFEHEKRFTVGRWGNNGVKPAP
jgi:hypothetical protein